MTVQKSFILIAGIIVAVTIGYALLGNKADLVVNAIFTGIGTGIGSYLATRYAISHVQKVEETIKKGKEQLGEKIKKQGEEA